MDRLVQAALVVVGVPAITAGYLVLAERALGLLPYSRRPAVRPWLWLGPGLVLLLVFLVYPSLNTLYLSFLDASSSRPVGFANFVFVFTDGTMLVALRNNVLWVVIFTALTVAFGLLIALLADRVPYESAAKAVVFLPMGISFVAAGVIWRFMYDFRPLGFPQTGTLNALLMTLIPNFQPQAWLIDNVPWNNVALIAAAAWVWTGFCMVVLSAALKGVPTELLEAARVDGASELQVLRHVIVPMIGSTIAVVTTTMIIFALKAFDIVYVMTNGNFETEVIANRMYKEMFNVRDFGRASAIAVVLLAAIVPIMLFNIRRFRQQEEIR
ncbi:MAG: ABC transporter permease subunit [Chloroflexi bacterium]|nr:ABC transporter permease subunit [Chloroflexota bacterium]